MVEVSIIIPTANRASSLGITLKSLLKNENLKERFEIIVVDNGSVDSTKEIILNFISSYPRINTRYFFEPIPGLLSGRHRGALEAQGNILIFIDDDIDVSKEWLPSILDAFNNPDVHLVGGRNLPKYEVNPPGWLEYFWKTDKNGKYCGWLSLLDFGDRVKEVDPSYVWGLNYAIRKQTLFDLGGFHPDCIPSAIQYYQGDGETGLSLKIKEKKLKALYSPGAVIHHLISRDRLTSDYFQKRAFYQGVCDSYTEIRKTGKVGDLKERKKSSSTGFKRKFTDFKYNLCLFIKDKKEYKNRNEYRWIKTLTDGSYILGYNYHQTEIGKSRVLFEWVMRENYFNYELPLI